jgi:hypothetical protein
MGGSRRRDLDLEHAGGTRRKTSEHENSTSMGAIEDPIGVGAVSNLAHPGGNVTGFSTQNFELEEKRFELVSSIAAWP